MREIGKSRIEYPDTYIVVDIEATGLNPETERLIEVAAIKYVNHKRSPQGQGSAGCGPPAPP